MKARYYPSSNNKNRTKDFWEKIFQDFSYSEYLDTLNYDEPTVYIRKCFEKQSRNSRVLDIGCGAGRFLHLLSEMGFSDLTGLDLSFSGVKHVKKHVSEAKTIQTDATSLPFKEDSFDIVLMVGIVYEIEDKKAHYKVFEEIHRVLRQGGLFIFVNNSPYNLGEKIFTLTESFKLKKTDKEFFFVWRYTYNDVRKLSKKAGLSIIETVKCNFGMALFRFLYGIFVSREVKRNRFERLNTTRINPYSLNEHFLANKNINIFNLAGRISFRLRKYLRILIYNSEVFFIKLEKKSGN